MPTAPAAPTTVSGRRYLGATTAGVHADRIEVDYGDKIWLYHSDRFPVTSAVQKVRSGVVTSPVWFHFERQPTPRYATVVTADSSAYTAVVVGSGHGARFIKDDIWVNLRTWDAFLVTSISTDTVTATSGWGVMPKAAIKVGDRLKKIGSAALEGAKARAAVGTLDDKYTFRAQEFRDSIEITNRLRATRMRVDSDLFMGMKDEKLWQHKNDINDSFYWGRSKRTSGSTGERTASMGLVQHISTNTWNVNGAMTWGDLSSFVSGNIAPWNPESVLMMITSAHVKSIINNWALEHLQVPMSISKWGLDIDSLLIVGGRKVVIVEDPMFNESSEMSQMAFVGSLKHTAWRGFDQDYPIAGKASMARSTKFHMNILQDDNPSVTKAEWTTFGGWEFWAERAWGMLWNVKW